MATRMQQRRGTSTQWTSANPVLNIGEIGFETDTNQFKIGDGANHWNDLSYFVDETALSTSLGDYVETDLLGVANGVATLNSSGVLESSQLPDISEITSDTMNDVLVAGSGITKNYDDNGNTITLSVDVSILDEMSQDAIDAALVAGTGLTKNYDDNANTITLAVDTTVVATKAELAEVAQDSINDALIAGTGITKSYDDNGNTITVSINSNVVTTLTDTQTLTNKVLTSPVINLSLNAQTGTSYTLVLLDNGKVVTFDNADPITVSVPVNDSVAYPIGSQINLAQIGAGQVTVQGGIDVTVNGTPGLSFRGQYSLATLIKVDTNSWILAGDLSE